ncbi:MAG: PHB depolymerase family esterase [Deltaproteobacteria bacterium]
MRVLLLGSLAVALAACSTDSRRADRSELSVQPARPGGEPAVAGAGAREGAGRSERSSSSGGVARRWLLYLPRAASASAALPLVFNLHGSGGTPEDQLALSGLEALAESEGFVLVAPEGVDRMWNVPVDAAKADDVRFLAELIDQVSALTSVDQLRVYATGFSGGGRMVSQLACDLSERIAAVAAIGGIRFPGPCSNARSMPILAFHGTADDTNPYAGGGRPYWGTGVEPAVSGWAEHNHCPTRSERPLAPSTLAISYGGAGCGAEVALVRLDGFGHSWPDRIGTALAGGNETADMTANQTFWSFFQRHPLPVAKP